MHDAMLVVVLLPMQLPIFKIHCFFLKQISLQWIWQKAFYTVESANWVNCGKRPNNISIWAGFYLDMFTNDNEK